MRIQMYVALLITTLFVGCNSNKDGDITIAPNEKHETTIVEVNASKTPQDLIEAAELAAKNKELVLANTLIDSYLEKVSTNEAYGIIELKWSGAKEVRNRIFSIILAKKLAEKTNDSRAIYRLGLAYYSGKGAQKDYDKALTYFRHETQAKNVGVMYYMADMLLDDAYTGFDKEEGMRLLKASANGGYQPAIDRLK